MTAFVVDTNVAIAANGRATHADLQCRRSCVERLAAVVKEETIAIDDAGLISTSTQGTSDAPDSRAWATCF